MRIHVGMLFAVLIFSACRRGLPDDGGMTPNPALYPATLTGKILDRSTGKGIERASVLLTPRGGDVDSRTAISSSTGDFQIINIPPGDYEVAFSARGFQPQASTMRFHPHQNAGRQVSLSPVAIACPRVRVGKPLPGCG